MSLNKVQIKYTIKDSWDKGFGALLSIKNSKNNYTICNFIIIIIKLIYCNRPFVFSKTQ